MTTGYYKCYKDYHDFYNDVHYKVGDVVRVDCIYSEEAQHLVIEINERCVFEVTSIEKGATWTYEVIILDHFDPLNRPHLMNLINSAITNSCQIPNFIDPKQLEHYTAWNITSDILNEIGYLVDFKVRSDKEMKEFYEAFVILESNYVKVGDKIYKKCVSYINKILWSYLDYALKNEEFETVANFKKFKILKDKNPRLITLYLKEKNL